MALTWAGIDFDNGVLNVRYPLDEGTGQKIRPKSFIAAAATAVGLRSVERRIR